MGLFARSSCLRLLGASVLLAAATPVSAEKFTFNHEHILGTSLEIQVEAASLAAATAAEGRVLTEIDRLSKVFSTYESDSEFSRWQSRTGIATPVSPELLQGLAASDRYRTLSHGAFHPAVQSLTQVWQHAEKRQQLPTTAELQTAVALVQRPQWTLDTTTSSATRLVDGPLSLNAIAKGGIVDAACQAALPKSGEVTGLVVCIGGDLRVAGDSVQPVHIVDPTNDAVNAPTVTTVYLHNQGLATSGNYRRGVKIQDQWYSHIIDPRTGRPTDHIASATVVAATTMDADALATTFSVLNPEETATLAATLPGVEYFLIGRDGQRYQSPGWADLEQPQLYRLAAATEKVEQVAVEPAAPAAPLHELTVKFELNKPTGAQYRRPYVAVWLEDADEFPVRTALLFMQTKQPGPRWHRDLLRWYRNDALRKVADGKDLIGTISGATRGPGEYKAVFDGKDDAGQPLPAGKYTLFLEVAREHGTYQLIRQSVTLGADPIAETKLKTNVEIKSASFEYRPAQPAAAQ